MSSDESKMDRRHMTPTAVVVANIKVYMRWRRLTHVDLAERMTLLGLGFEKEKGGRTKWHPRTVGQVLKGKRRIDINEVFALAVALETTVGALLSPRVEGVLNLDATYDIANLDAIGAPAFEILLEDLGEKQSRPSLTVGNWPTELHPESVPRWVEQRTPLQQQLAEEMEALKEKHPELDLDAVSLGEILTLMEQDNDTGKSMN